MLKIIQQNLKKSQTFTNQILDYADKEKIDILSIQEPHAFNFENNIHNIKGVGPEFNVYYHHSNRYPNAAIFVRKNIISFYDHLNSNHACSIVVFESFVLMSIYMKRVNKEGNRREIVISHLRKVLEVYRGKRVLISGDGNCRHSFWGDHWTDERGERMNEFLIDNELTLLNEPHQGPTFHASFESNDCTITKSSYIDLTFINSNFVNNNFVWSKLDDITNSDHSTIVIELDSSSSLFNRFSYRKYIDFDKTDWLGFLNCYNSLKPNVKNMTNFENFFVEFDKSLELASKKYIRFKVSRYYDNLPWYKHSLTHLKTKITEIRRRLSHCNFPAERLELKSLLSSVNLELKKNVRILKSKYYSSLHEVSSVDDFWRVWNKSRISKNENIPLFNDNISKSLNENLEILSNHFIAKSKFCYNKLNIVSDDYLSLTDFKELDQIINNMNDKKAPGLDNISNKLIKIIYANDKKYINDLFNIILTNSRIPKCWKIGRMIFLNKNNPIKVPKDLRPITLIKGWCKIAESLFTSRLEDRLNKLRFFNPAQFGFVKGKSTIDAIEHLFNNINSRKSCKFKMLVAIDFSGAFDNISWQSIIGNLVRSKIEPHFVKAAETILIDRMISIDNYKNLIRCTKGCPQGGCASPFLWRVGMNSLLEKLKDVKCLKFTAYADDLILMISTSDLNQLEIKLRESFDIINSWCTTTELKLNLDKTKFMLLNKRKIPRDIKLYDNRVSLSKDLKYLGVVIDKNLTWNSHLEHLENKINKLLSRINYFSFIKSEIELLYKRKLYNSVFIPTMCYASNIWYPSIANKSSSLSKLNILQNRVLRSLFKTYKCTNSEKLLKLKRIVNIIAELNILKETTEIDKKLRSSSKKEMRLSYFSKLDYDFIVSDSSVIDKFKNKFALWCLLDTGPFKQFLCKIGKTEDIYCRYCNLEVENFSHFYYSCEKFKNIINSCNFEHTCTYIVKKLNQDKHLL